MEKVTLKCSRCGNALELVAAWVKAHRVRCPVCGLLLSRPGGSVQPGGITSANADVGAPVHKPLSNSLDELEARAGKSKEVGLGKKHGTG